MLSKLSRAIMQQPLSHTASENSSISHISRTRFLVLDSFLCTIYTYNKLQIYNIACKHLHICTYIHLYVIRVNTQNIFEQLGEIYFDTPKQSLRFILKVLFRIQCESRHCVCEQITLCVLLYIYTLYTIHMYIHYYIYSRYIHEYVTCAAHMRVYILIFANKASRRILHNGSRPHRI